MCEDLDKVRSWADVILLLYSVTDSESYVTATLAHKHINNYNNNNNNNYNNNSSSSSGTGSGSGQPNRKVWRRQAVIMSLL